jgi:hypothetical protein
MSSVTGSTTNLTFTVPTSEASGYESLLTGMGLIPYPDSSSDEDPEDDFLGGSDSTPTLTESTNSSGDVVVNDGTYTITTGSENGGSAEITNDATGAVVASASGDPHVYDGTGKEVANIQNSDFDIDLPDGTDVELDPTATTNGVAHLGAETISNGNDQVQINSQVGSGQGFENGVSTTGVSFVPDAAAYAQYDNASGVNLFPLNGDLYVSNDDTGALTALTATNGTPVDLDTDQQATGASSSSGDQTLMQQLEQLLNTIITTEQQQQQQELSQLLSSLGSNSYSSGINPTNLFELPSGISAM